MASMVMLSAFRSEQQKIEQHRRAIRLADGLLLALRLNPHSHELIAWVADTRCRDNRDALTVWVVGQLNDFPLDTGASELLTLMERLTCSLNRIADGVNHARA